MQPFSPENGVAAAFTLPYRRTCEALSIPLQLNSLPRTVYLLHTPVSLPHWHQSSAGTH